LLRLDWNQLVVVVFRQLKLVADLIQSGFYARVGWRFSGGSAELCRGHLRE
jgi:hypothetical protein